MKEPLVTDELIIVGVRHGDIADRLVPLFEKGEAIGVDEILKIIGDEELYLKKTSNIQDRHAIGVFTATTQKRIGFIWTYQAYSMREWMEEHQEEHVRICIVKVNPKYGFMIAKPCNKMNLYIHPRQSLYMDMDWADNLPRKLLCRNDEWLELSMMVLDDALDECEAWNDRLRAKIDNVVNELPYVLSSLGDMKGIELYLKMKDSSISEVREHSGRLLYAMTHRGAPERMEWWMKNCLTNYYKDAKEENLLSLFESANFTLEKVEALLHQAPEHLYHVYLGDRGNFAKRLYYSGLPHDLYVRLMTLLSVREAMLENSGGSQEEKHDSPSATVSKCFKFTSNFTKERVKSIVDKYYLDSHANLALIEIALYDHGQLKKRNAHKALLKALAAWDVLRIANNDDLELMLYGIRDKYNRLPKTGGYLDWGSELLNEKNTCISIGKELGDTAPYRYAL